MFRRFSITAAPPNLEVIMSYIILFDRQFVPLSGPNSHRTRTEHVQNEGCFFGEKGTRNCNASITVAPPILEVVIAGRSSLDQRFVPFRGPNSHRTRTEHVQNEEYFSVRREPATVMLCRNYAVSLSVVTNSGSPGCEGRGIAKRPP